jgi:hypothetical protein
MNYIKKLQEENAHLKNSLESAINELIDYQRYYNSSKFTSVENDFAHVSTDVYIKITTIKMYLQNTLNAL